MNAQKILLMIVLQLIGFSAMAMGQRNFAVGEIEVTQAFTAKETKDRATKTTGAKMVFPKGKYKFSIGSYGEERKKKCSVFGCDDKIDMVYYMNLGMRKWDAKEEQWMPFGSIAFVSGQGRLLKDGTYAEYGKDMNQSFNVFTKSSQSEWNEKYTESFEDCEVPLYRNTGYYGGGRVYGLGRQKVKRHERVSRTSYTIKITDVATNNVIATFKGINENDYRKSVVDSQGECKLNAENY